ncbi:MAG: nucleotidyltransferase domain-containing protein [Candidatus Woesearchaeota archaeon]
MVIKQSSAEIIRVLLSSPWKERSILEISNSTRINYRIVYQEVMDLRGRGIINITKKGASNMCTINLAKDIQAYAYVESLRSESFKKKHPDIEVVGNELGRVKTTYYSAIIFGSYAKGKATGRSDLDILFIIPNTLKPEIFEKEVSSRFKLLSYKLDINVITEESFLEMKDSKTLNIVTEALKDHIILFGGEAYYRLLAK